MKKMSKQDVETVIFENAKTGEALEFQHEQHKAEYGAKRSPQRMSLSEPIKPLLENWNAMLQQFVTHSKR